MRFSFGANWQAYATRALTPERVEQARRDFGALLAGIDLRGKRFLDIGFGQGLALGLAAEMGAEVLGIDIDPVNLAALETTQRALGLAARPETRLVSILDETLVRTEAGRYDVVHSWGVLHHTGRMWQAMTNACALVGNDGFLVVAIYNRHWSSPVWKAIKWCYNRLPRLGQEAAVAAFYPIVYVAKWLVTGHNPARKERGMDFHYDLVDWLGGYPYEYASAEEVRQFVCRQGFVCLRTRPATVPTGCNEFVFQRRAEKPRSGSLGAEGGASIGAARVSKRPFCSPDHSLTVAALTEGPARFCQSRARQ